jgi:hypothetical protein
MKFDPKLALETHASQVYLDPKSSPEDVAAAREVFADPDAHLPIEALELEEARIYALLNVEPCGRCHGQSDIAQILAAPIDASKRWSLALRLRSLAAALDATDIATDAKPAAADDLAADVLRDREASPAARALAEAVLAAAR